MDSGFLGPGFAMAVLAVASLAFALWVVVGGGVMTLAARWAGGLRVGYPRACGVVALSGAVALGLGVAMTLAVVAFGVDSGLGTTVLLLGRAVLGLLIPVVVIAACVHWLLPGAGPRLSPARSLGVAAAYCALMLGGVPGMMR